MPVKTADSEFESTYLFCMMRLVQPSDRFKSHRISVPHINFAGYKKIMKKIVVIFAS